jgi:hypothetical protein
MHISPSVGFKGASLVMPVMARLMGDVALTESPNLGYNRNELICRRYPVFVSRRLWTSSGSSDSRYCIVISPVDAAP